MCMKKIILGILVHVLVKVIVILCDEIIDAVAK